MWHKGSREGERRSRSIIGAVAMAWQRWRECESKRDEKGRGGY